MQVTYELIQELREDRSGIFNWLLEGYETVRKQGGFSFDMDKMKAKERRTFKRKVAQITEVLRKVFGPEDFQQLEEKGLIATIPEQLYKMSKHSIEAIKEQPGGIMEWLEEGRERVESEGGASGLASKIAKMPPDEREDFMREALEFMGLLQDELSISPQAREEMKRRTLEIQDLVQKKLNEK